MLSDFLSSVPYWPDAPAWLSTRVFACAAAVVGLAVLAVILKGLQKVITLLIAVGIVLGGYWLAQDAWIGHPETVPSELGLELDALAARLLANKDALAAWEAAQKEWENWNGEAKTRLAAGGEVARETIAKRLDSKVTELRKQGKKTAAEELARLRQKVDPTGGGTKY